MRIVNVLLVFVCMELIGCVRLQNLGEVLGGGGVELAEGRYHRESVGADRHPPSLNKQKGSMTYHDRIIVADGGTATGHHFTLNEPRFIRYILLKTVDPIKNIVVYVRTGGENWTIARQLKKPVDAETRIEINMRADDIRVEQRTDIPDTDDVIRDIKVYVQKR